MDPLTHALASVTLGRALGPRAVGAGAARISARAMTMLVVAGTAADLDWASVGAGPQAYLRWHLTATHSVAATLVIAAAVSALFARTARGGLRWGKAFGACLLAAALHVTLDLTNGVGLALWWPFSQRRFAADLLPPLDLWLLAGLALLLGIPWVFQLASQEMGFLAAGRPSRAALVALALLAVYVGARWTLHARALRVMEAQLFHDEAPLRVGAFPEGTNPFLWDGVVATRNTLQEARVPVAAGPRFSSESARVFPKPADSPVLEAARSAPLSVEFLRYAEFPRAQVERTESGYRVEIDDLRFDRTMTGSGGISVEVELDEHAQVLLERMRWGHPLER
jgi:membrane-bound metal-dependent hydrolase YbcI (DUF457 family)